MILSRDRILTTHVGSLPRNETLSDLLVRREDGEAIDKDQLAREMDLAVHRVVDKQAAAGIDIANDGEQQRVGFQTYVPQRMSGFAGESKRRRGRDFEEFPELVALLMQRFPKRSRMQNAPEAQAELHYLDTAPIELEIARLQRATHGANANFAECFLTAPSPGIISSTMLNAFYDSQEAYLTAIAREMRNEYLAIHKAGLLLQIDSPDLAMDRSMFYRDLSDERLRQGRRDARGRDQQGDRRHPARPRSSALLLGQLGWPAHPRRAAGADPAGAVSGERRGAEHRIRQSAASA